MLIVVAYHEFAEAEALRCSASLAQRARALLGHTSVREAIALVEIGQSNRCASLAAWTDEEAEKLQPSDAGLDGLELAPPDVRLHHPWSMGNVAPEGAEAVFVLTHVDVPPPQLPALEAMFRPFVEASRAEKGALRFDAVQSTTRPNHFTLIEGWENEGARRAHAAASHARGFRTALTPLLGALYDQRLYRRIG